MKGNPLIVKNKTIFKPLIIGQQYDKKILKHYFDAMMHEGQEQVGFKYNESDVRIYMFNRQSIAKSLDFQSHVATIGWKSREEGVLQVDHRYKE